MCCVRWRDLLTFTLAQEGVFLSAKGGSILRTKQRCSETSTNIFLNNAVLPEQHRVVFEKIPVPLTASFGTPDTSDEY